MRYKITLAYEGTSYAGWQVQPNGLSIQTLVQRALETALRHAIQLTGAGRTDAGVHAEGQTAHFDTPLELDLRKMLLSCNALLPPDIRVRRIEPVEDAFHARYSAKGKIYHYHLHLGRVMPPFFRLFRAHLFGPFALEKVEKAIPFLIGTRDFTSFSNQPHRGAAAKNGVRTLRRITLASQEGGVRLEFEADGFLYRMVRNLTGLLVEIGKGKRHVEEIESIFLAKDRKLGPETAPARGLFLKKVLY